MRSLPIARSLIAIEARAAEAVSGEVLRLGACSNIGVYVLPEVMRDYRTAALGALSTVMIGTNPAIAAALEQAEIDIALMEWWDGRPGLRPSHGRMNPFWRSHLPTILGGANRASAVPTFSRSG